jgi:DnaK suppressor protein
MTELTLPTPLQRLQLREALQDRWRDHVRQITELSVQLHAALGGQVDDAIDAAAVAVAISDARLRLAETERALRRLDDRSYGRCDACLVPIPTSVLIDDPELRYCAGCRQQATTRATAVADAG